MKLAFADAYAHVVRFAQHAAARPSEMLDDAYLAEPRAPDRHEARAAVRRRQSGQGRHDLPQRGRRARHDGELHPEQLHGLRLGRRRSGLGRLDAEPRPRLRPRPGEPELRRARAGGRSTPSSRRSSPGRPAADELRHHGRQHAAAGAPADDRAHARPPPAAAGGVRCAALALQRRAQRSTSRRRWRPRPSPAWSSAATGSR